MKIYLVGGAVRDKLLGLEPKDHDYVVVGATPEMMINAGYREVGAEFPVYIHPETGDEYALARTEYKDGQGYKGFRCTFGPEVTLEEDLARRDLTINAMAMDIITEELIDPYGGQTDLEARLLRPTTDAFQEDPVRLLRAGRFLARYPEFSASVELFGMKHRLIESGELNHLTPERVWMELEKTLGEKKPSRFFQFLNYTGIFPELEAMIDLEEHNRWHPEHCVFEHVMMVVDYSTCFEDKLTTFGALCHDLGKPAAYKATGGLKSTKHEALGAEIAKSFCERLKAPAEYRWIALKSAAFHTHCHLSFEMKPKTIHKLYKEFRQRKGMFERLLQIAESDKRGRGAPACDWVYTQPAYLRKCVEAVHSVDTKAITLPMVAEGKTGPAIGEAVRRAEIAAIGRVDKSEYEAPYNECHAEVIRKWNEENA